MRKILFNSTFLIFTTFLLSSIPQQLAAQDPEPGDEQDSSSVIARDATHFMETGLGIFAAPFLFDSQDWTNVGLIVGGTALLFTVDKNVKDFALRNHTKLNDKIFDMDSYQGNEYSLFLSWGIYGYGAIAGNDKVRKVGLNATEAFIYSGMITGVLKVLIGRRRPYAGNDHLLLRPFQVTDSDYQALPSGHSTVSFAVSTVIAKSVDNIFWKVFWYGSAGLVGASRVYHNKHWLSDIFLGAAIGYTVGNYVVNFDNSEKPKMFGKKVQPYMGLNVIGLRIYLN